MQEALNHAWCDPCQRTVCDRLFRDPGGPAGLVLSTGIFVVQDWIGERRRAKTGAEHGAPSLDDILESQIRDHIGAHFAELFPGWRVVDEPAGESRDGADGRRPSGVEYRTEAGVIDILCRDEDEGWVVIELKRHRASDRVVAQLDRYMAWIERALAQPGQRVRGLVIAQDFDPHLHHTLLRRRGMEARTYRWGLELGPHVVGKEEGGEGDMAEAEEAA